MPTTAKGLFYPEGTDLVKEAPIHMQSLAESVDVLLDSFKPSLVNGMSVKVNRRLATLGPFSLENSVVATGSFTLTATTTVEFLANWSRFVTSSATTVFTRIRLNSTSGSIVTTQGQLQQPDVAYGGSIYGYSTLPAGTYTAHLTTDPSVGSLEALASSTEPITIMARPLL